jgi:hypothetical protein
MKNIYFEIASTKILVENAILDYCSLSPSELLETTHNDQANIQAIKLNAASKSCAKELCLF